MKKQLPDIYTKDKGLLPMPVILEAFIPELIHYKPRLRPHKRTLCSTLPSIGPDP